MLLNKLLLKIINIAFVFTLNFCIVQLDKPPDISSKEKIPSRVLPNINLELKNSGFHRDLYYEVEFEKFPKDQHCKFMLKQDLPAAVYINVDQVNDLVRLKKLNAIYPPHVDVELPTKDSQSFTVFLSLSSELQQNISLPIHFRYHSPGDTRHVRVDLDKPSMYMNCGDDSLFVHEKRKESYCFDRLKFTKKPSDSHQDCDWIQIDYNPHLKTPLNADIPIGYLDLYKPVAYITIIIGWVGCALLLFLINNKAASVHNKMNDHHID